MCGLTKVIYSIHVLVRCELILGFHSTSFPRPSCVSKSRSDDGCLDKTFLTVFDLQSFGEAMQTSRDHHLVGKHIIANYQSLYIDKANGPSR